jgi:hypothetical protein
MQRSALYNDAGWAARQAKLEQRNQPNTSKKEIRSDAEWKGDDFAKQTEALAPG